MERAKNTRNECIKLCAATASERERIQCTKKKRNEKEQKNTECTRHVYNRYVIANNSLWSPSTCAPDDDDYSKINEASTKRRAHSIGLHSLRGSFQPAYSPDLTHICYISRKLVYQYTADLNLSPIQFKNSLRTKKQRKLVATKK